MKNFLKFVKKKKSRILEIIFTHSVSSCGLIGFFVENLLFSGSTPIHYIMAILALLVLVVVPPATWYRLYRLYKKSQKYDF